MYFVLLPSISLSTLLKFYVALANSANEATAFSVFYLGSKRTYRRLIGRRLDALLRKSAPGSWLQRTAQVTGWSVEVAVPHGGPFLPI